MLEILETTSNKGFKANQEGRPSADALSWTSWFLTDHYLDNLLCMHTHSEFHALSTITNRTWNLSSFVSSHRGNVLILSQCAVNFTYACSTDMSFAEKFAVLIVPHPRNFIQPHWEVRRHQAATQCWKESISLNRDWTKVFTRNTPSSSA